MTAYASDIHRIKNASSLHDIQNIVRQYSGEAPAGSSGGILYTGRVGDTKSEVIALEIADLTGQPIINRTPRAQFLVAAEREIKDSTLKIYELQGKSYALAEQSATSFLYGDANAPIHSETSLDGCLWGETSREFSGSLKGDVTLIASQAQIGRVFAAAEVPAALENGNISSLAGHSTDTLRQLARHGDVSEIVKLTQERFIKAAPHGIFVSPNNSGPGISKVVISKEVAASLGLDSTPFSSTADLTAAGLKRVSTLAVVLPQATAVHTANNPAPASPGNLTAANGTDELNVAMQTERTVARVAKLAAGSAAIVLTAVDGYTTAEQYHALSSQGNQFGADALLRRYEGRTAGGILGSMVAGASYGFITGAETGPGAFLTGAAGGVIGAFAGEEIAKAINEHKVNYQTGTDGVTYSYENGQWGRTQYDIDQGSAGPANPYNAPNYTSTRTPAPHEQIGQLEYQRMTAVTGIALANPATQDTKHIELSGTNWHATPEGWAQPMDIPGLPNTYGIPSSITVDQPADAKTSQALSQLAENRQFYNDHYAKDVANGYVMDYYGKDWAANGPLPDVVTKPLGLPSEQHIKDPVTGNIWNATAKGDFSREAAILLDKMVIRETVIASGEECDRLARLQQSASHSNEAYGKELIAQNFEKSVDAQRSAHDARSDERVLSVAAPGREGGNSPTVSAPSVDAAAPKLALPITPQSSNREMFDAMMTAAQNLDVDAMRSVSQNYLQSPQGQAWLEQGQQFNQQQAVVQQQVVMDVQQQLQATQAPMR